MASLGVECEQGKLKRAGNKDQDGVWGDGEVIWAKARKREFLNRFWDRISTPFLVGENS